VELRVKVLFAPPAAKAAPAPKMQGKPSAEELERLQKEMPQLKKFQELFGAEIIDTKKS
jgi:hypothetical protein